MELAEIDDVLNTMVVVCDTREQDTPLLRERLNQIRAPVIRGKLDAGDYMARFTLPDESIFVPGVAIERKMNLDELANCYCKGRKRFEREFQRAKDKNIKLYLLIENDSLDKAYAGQYRSHMSAQSMTGSIMTWLARYGCQIIFVNSRLTGKVIYDILRHEARERLEEMCYG